MDETATKKNLVPDWTLNWALIIGIVIVINIFSFYVIDLFYPEPQYEEFCGERIPAPQIINQSQCEAGGGLWHEDNILRKVPAPAEGNAEVEVTGYCDADHTCRTEFDDARNIHARNAFSILIVAGLALVLVGFLTNLSQIISASFSLGGILMILITSARFWTDADDYIRLTLIGLVLVTFIWLAIRRNKK